jgi:hypothetical protein
VCHTTASDAIKPRIRIATDCQGLRRLSPATHRCSAFLPGARRRAPTACATYDMPKQPAGLCRHACTPRLEGKLLENLADVFVTRVTCALPSRAPAVSTSVAFQRHLSIGLSTPHPALSPRTRGERVAEGRVRGGEGGVSGVKNQRLARISTCSDSVQYRSAFCACCTAFS